MAELEQFQAGLEQLQGNLPHWWATGDPTSNIYNVLVAIGGSYDELSGQVEDLLADAALSTATLDGLDTEWARLYGIGHEELPPALETRRAYIQARAAEDGSRESLITTLLALIATDVNLNGDELVFPGGGGGLTLPSTGLIMFQLLAAFRQNLVIPADGSGLAFPPLSLLDFAEDGTGIVLQANFPTESPITFGDGVTGWFDITEDFTGYRFTVTTKTWLTFVRAAVRRAMERFRQAHLLTPLLVETN